MEKVALYARVSGELQKEQKTIDSQLAELRNICKGFDVVEEYIDDGWSGATLDRPAIDQLREDAKNGKFTRLYIHAADRLARDLYKQGILVDELRKNEIKIFIKEKPIEDAPEAQFLFQILGAVSQFEKEKILERTQRGRIHKVKTKKILGWKAPYGWSYVRKTPTRDGYFYINKKEAEVVKLIFDSYIKHQSINRVVNILFDKGIKTRTGKKRWARSTIRAVLVNSAYTGQGYYMRRRSTERKNSINGSKYQRKAKSSQRWRDESEWLPVDFPPIISKRKFELANKTLKRNYRPYAQSKHFYLLSGVVRCSYCDSTFTGETKNTDTDNPYQLYRCNHRHRPNPNPPVCNAPNMPAKPLEKEVWDAISKAATHPRVLARHIETLAKNLTENKTELKNEIKDLQQELGEIKAKKERVLELYAGGAMDKAFLANNIRSYEKQEGIFKQKIEDAQVKLKQIDSKPAIRDHLRIFCQIARKKLQNLNLEEKRRFLNLLVEGVELDSRNRTAVIVGHIPQNPEVLKGQSPHSGKPAPAHGRGEHTSCARKRRC